MNAAKQKLGSKPKVYITRNQTESSAQNSSSSAFILLFVKPPYLPDMYRNLTFVICLTIICTKNIFMVPKIFWNAAKWAGTSTA